MRISWVSSCARDLAAQMGLPYARLKKRTLIVFELPPKDRFAKMGTPGALMVPNMSDAAYFRAQADECQQLATTARRTEDRQFWRKLTDDWLGLAKIADERRFKRSRQVYQTNKPGHTPAKSG